MRIRCSWMLLECDANVNTWEALTTDAYDHAALHNLQHLFHFLGMRVGQENALIVSLLFLCLMYSNEKTHTLPARHKKTKKQSSSPIITQVYSLFTIIVPEEAASCLSRNIFKASVEKRSKERLCVWLEKRSCLSLHHLSPTCELGEH